MYVVHLLKIEGVMGSALSLFGLVGYMIGHEALRVPLITLEEDSQRCHSLLPLFLGGGPHPNKAFLQSLSL